MVLIILNIAIQLISHIIYQDLSHIYCHRNQKREVDDTDRLFLSMNKASIGISSLKDVVIELIFEFFITPEILINKNNLNLGQWKTGSEN